MVRSMELHASCILGGCREITLSLHLSNSIETAVHSTRHLCRISIAGKTKPAKIESTRRYAKSGWVVKTKYLAILRCDKTEPFS